MTPNIIKFYLSTETSQKRLIPTSPTILTCFIVYSVVTIFKMVNHNPHSTHDTNSYACSNSRKSIHNSNAANAHNAQVSSNRAVKCSGKITGETEKNNQAAQHFTFHNVNHDWPCFFVNWQRGCFSCRKCISCFSA